jgi:uncharacterized protein (DUF433 family)
VVARQTLPRELQLTNAPTDEVPCDEETTMQFERITHDPAVMGGKPCIRGLRVTVSTLLGLLATGTPRERILSAYPYLEPEDLDAALAYAAWRLEEREESLVIA